MNLVHAGDSRHQDMKKKIQSKLEALAHPEDPMWRRLARVTVESKMTARLLHSTIKQEENNKSRGQYKTRVLSRYHRPTQNREQYISNNIINQL